MRYRWIADEMARIPEVVRLANAGTEVVRVGLASGIPSKCFLAAVELIRGRNPSIKMDLVDMASSDQEQALRRFTLDLAFMHHAPRGSQARQVLAQDLESPCTQTVAPNL